MLKLIKSAFSSFQLNPQNTIMSCGCRNTIAIYKLPNICDRQSRLNHPHPITTHRQLATRHKFTAHPNKVASLRFILEQLVLLLCKKYYTFAVEQSRTREKCALQTVSVFVVAANMQLTHTHSRPSHLGSACEFSG